MRLNDHRLKHIVAAILSRKFKQYTLSIKRFEFGTTKLIWVQHQFGVCVRKIEANHEKQFFSHDILCKMKCYLIWETIIIIIIIFMIASMMSRHVCAYTKYNRRHRYHWRNEIGTQTAHNYETKRNSRRASHMQVASYFTLVKMYRPLKNLHMIWRPVSVSQLVWNSDLEILCKAADCLRGAMPHSSLHWNEILLMCAMLLTMFEWKSNSTPMYAVR